MAEASSKDRANQNIDDPIGASRMRYLGIRCPLAESVLTRSVLSSSRTAHHKSVHLGAALAAWGASSTLAYRFASRPASAAPRSRHLCFSASMAFARVGNSRDEKAMKAQGH
jgi:hypothetical protein